MKTKVITKFVLEIRFRPSPVILDNRGNWTNSMKEEFSFDRWRITDNRIDLLSTDNYEQAFISHKNLGYAVNNSIPTNSFVAKCKNYINHIRGVNIFNTDMHIHRIGMRAYYYKLINSSYNTIKSKFSNNFGGVNQKAIDILKVDYKDIAIIVDLKDQLGSMHISCGPMEKDQAKTIFENQDESFFAERGLFFDIDYWTTPDSKVNTPKLIKTIEDLGHSCETRFNQVFELIAK